MILRLVCQLHIFFFFFFSQQLTGAWSSGWSIHLVVGGLGLEYLVEPDQRTCRDGSQ